MKNISYAFTNFIDLPPNVRRFLNEAYITAALTLCNLMMICQYSNVNIRMSVFEYLLCFPGENIDSVKKY